MKDSYRTMAHLRPPSAAELIGDGKRPIGLSKNVLDAGADTIYRPSESGTGNNSGYTKLARELVPS
ncbi:hypothetical protein M2345_000488 [Sphingobium sp. B8D3D]|nr:hypothetical protein [Sphingobium sp. B8D3D]MCW2416981.1 hypothetical protein [Sphingobium sp. B8D3A]